VLFFLFILVVDFLDKYSENHLDWSSPNWSTAHSFCDAEGTLPWQPIFRPNLPFSNHTFVALALSKGWQDRNHDFRRLNGNDFATLYRNLVGFGPVTREFTTLECVQQASVNIGMSINYIFGLVVLAENRLTGGNCAAIRFQFEDHRHFIHQQLLNRYSSAFQHK